MRLNHISGNCSSRGFTNLLKMASKDLPHHIERLRNEQDKAVHDTKEQIQQWLSFKSDYQALKTRLQTLPGQLTHDVMVPFGKMAFMPGQLVHTNEILVLLGDNWFVERSAKQAADIVDRRMKTVDKHLEELESQLKLLEPRRQFASELGGISQGAGDVQDIREEYDEEKEATWRAEHKKRVKEYRRSLKKDKAASTKKKRSTVPPAEDVQRTDEELWVRLNQLEEIETKRRELLKVGTSAEEKLNNYKFPEWSGSSAHTDRHTDRNVAHHSSDKRNLEHPTCDTSETDVKLHNEGGSPREDKFTGSDLNELDSDDDFDDEDIDEGDDDNDGDDNASDDDDDEDYSDDAEEAEVTGKGKLITFSHTANTPAVIPQQDSDHPSTPGDLYLLYNKPKSILKKSTTPRKKVKQKVRTPKVAFDTGSEEEEMHKQQISSQERQRLLQAAFSGTVKEKSTELPAFPTQPSSSTKPVSKFKSQAASRNTERTVTQTHAESAKEMDSTGSERPVSKFRAERLKKS